LGRTHNARRQPSTALSAVEPRQFALEALTEKPPRVDDSGGAASIRVVPKIAGDQIIRAGSESAFEEPVVVLIAGGVDSPRGLVPNRNLLESGQYGARALRNLLEFFPRKHFPIFGQNRRRDADYIGARQPESYGPGFETIRFPARRNQHIRIENGLQQTAESDTIVRIG
jgi:hypothetical protein